MKRITSMLTVAFVVFLLLVATTTANSQEATTFSKIYCVDSDGTLKEYLARDADTELGLPRTVGGGWGDYLSVFPGGGNGVIYGIGQDGALMWLGYAGRGGRASWVGPKNVGRGWNGFKQVFSAGGGIIYIIEKGGPLRWYKHSGYLTGEGTPGAWEGPKVVGFGWAGFKQVFPGGDGIIYAITQDGKLRWYKHKGYQTGAGLETPGAWEGARDVGSGWAGFKNVFSPGGGIIYALTQDGKLLRYKHNGYRTGAGLETPGAWEDGKEVGRGLGDFVHVFALLTGSFSPADEERPRTPDADGDLGSRGGALEKKRDPGRVGAAFQPENTIKVSVRYKKELGYLGDTNAFGYVGPTSCNAFSVSAVVGNGSEQSTNPIRVSGDSKMEVIAGYYFCNYLVSDIPLNQPVRLSVRVSGDNQIAPWKGGSLGQPPPGQQRTIIIVSGREGDPLTLTATQPRARQLFEMVYTSQPR